MRKTCNHCSGALPIPDNFISLATVIPRQKMSQQMPFVSFSTSSVATGKRRTSDAYPCLARPLAPLFTLSACCPPFPLHYANPLSILSAQTPPPLLLLCSQLSAIIMALHPSHTILPFLSPPSSPSQIFALLPKHPMSLHSPCTNLHRSPSPDR